MWNVEGSVLGSRLRANGGGIIGLHRQAASKPDLLWAPGGPSLFRCAFHSRGHHPRRRFHTACLFLLGALAAAAPAEAQHPCTPSYAEDVWCATMTVAEFTRSTGEGPQPTFGYTEGFGGNLPDTTVGGLSPTTFTYDGESYTVRYLLLLRRMLH